MDIKQKLKTSALVLDGAMGTQLQSLGLPAGTPPEEWNLTDPEKVKSVHAAYLAAGADIILTNTFGANPLKYGEGYENVVRAAVKTAKAATALLKDKFVALDLGPTGKLLKPLGNLSFEEAVDSFKKVIRAADGVDLIFIETMNDIYEAKAAILAAKEECNLPVFATCVFGADGKTLTGSSPETVVAVFEGLGVDALGLNCSLAPHEMRDTVKRMLAVASTPIIVKPNAGLPGVIDGETVYSLTADEFAQDMHGLLRLGVRCVGGCCGTTPEYIKKLSAAAKTVRVRDITPKNVTVATAYTNALEIGKAPVLIGERINPTGKKRLKQAIIEGDTGYILNEAVTQTENGVHALDVNVGLPEIDEVETLTKLTQEIQAVTDLPLQLDSSDPAALDGAMRVYNGKPLVNSVNGKQESMQAIFPLVKKYGGVVIALTLDENGIPATASGRIEIAKRILNTAKEYGIDKKDIIFDTLAMTVSADNTAAREALRALKILRYEYGVNTSLGVSNISFGLPNRDFLNSTFFAMALASGLSAAIINPNSAEMIKAYKSYMALAGLDISCAEYIKFASSVTSELQKVQTAENEAADDGLKYCIVKGLKSQAAEKAKELLTEYSPLEIIDGYIIPALDETGIGFENKTVFLPQLLMSAEAASAAFEVLKGAMGKAQSGKKLKIVLATVKGDVHDIGKNIVKTLLENYGFTVIDLGRDVPPESVVEAVKKNGAQLVGLSALMTTTVGAMRQTISLLKSECAGCKVIVGGAVITDGLAEDLGADGYGADAMSTVRFAEQLEKDL